MHLIMGRFVWRASVFMLLGLGSVCAETLDLSLPKDMLDSRKATHFLLASNDTAMGKPESAVGATSAPSDEFRPKRFSGTKMHQYLGVSTAVLAGAAFMTHPHPSDPNAPREVNGVHAQLAKATVAMAAATIAFGLVSHWDDFSFEDGWKDPDNLHVVLGMAGAALMAYAVEKSATSSSPVEHAREAELGALGMIVAIKLTW